MNTENNETQATSALGPLLNLIVKNGPKIAQNKAMLNMAVKMGDNFMTKNGDNRLKSETSTPAGVINDQTALSLAILYSAKRLLAEHKLSDATYEKAGNILGRDLFIEKSLLQEKSKIFEEKYGVKQPSLLLISPTKACNLHCTGCYADSDQNVQSLDWNIVDRIITEAHDMWGIQFSVVSGGEPLVYRSQGKTLLDLAEKHDNNYFMFYSNGTLMTDEVIQRMADLGNIIPMLSLEGWRERTDARRGPGIFDKVVNTMDRLYDAGMLYGVSITPTRENAEEILSDEFMDFLFLEKHVGVGWLFQYMPIGRSYTLEMMPTPQQRIKMWRKSWELVREKKYFLADFWNSGTAVNGCLSAGGHGNGGYFYIDWNGNVNPCVFVPYSPVNIKDVYARGGTLNDVFTEPFFADIRKWQAEMSVKTKGQNVLNPCPIRDHNADFREILRKHEPEPSDQNAATALQDADYAKGMDAYDAEYQHLVDTVWEKAYVQASQLSEEELETIIKQDGHKIQAGVES